MTVLHEHAAVDAAVLRAIRCARSKLHLPLRVSGSSAGPSGDCIHVEIVSNGTAAERTKVLHLFKDRHLDAEVDGALILVYYSRGPST